MLNIFLNYNRCKFLTFIKKKKKNDTLSMHNLRALKLVFIYMSFF